MKAFFLNACIYSLRTLYGLFLCVAVIGGLDSIFSNDAEESVWVGLSVAAIIYFLGHYLFLKPSRFFVQKRDGNYNKEEYVPSGHIEITLHTEYISPQTYVEPEKSKNRTKGKWINPHEEITVGKKTIIKGLFYFGGLLQGDNSGEIESSLVDDGLSIGEATYTFVDNSLSYWPSFRDLSPMCRGAYIDWLASDRDMPDVPIGYVFIYFYGLERRIIKDYREGAVSDEQCAEICNEVLRLKSIFKDNYSFSGYAARLLDYVSITYPSIFCLPDDEIEDSIYSNIFKVKLAYVAQNNEALNPELAYTWIKSHPDYNLRTPARRCAEEFKALFIRKYKEVYQGGIIIKPNKTKLRLDYRPASRSLNYFRFGPSGLCDLTVLSAPVKKLAEIAMQCTDELDAYSRYLGKQDSSKDDIEALVLLPNELIDEFEIPLIKNFKSWAENIIAHKDGICDFKDFWQHTELPLPTKVNKKEQELTCNLIEKSGYFFAPHPGLHGSKFNIDDPLVIYKGDISAPLENSVVFDDVSVKLRLGSIIANADLKIHDNEVSFLKNIIHSNDNLTSREKLSLEAYLKWLLNSSSNFNGLKASLGKLRDKDNVVIRKVLINVALSDGKVTPSEVRGIERLYATLGLDKSTVPADIHGFSSNRGELINEVSGAALPSAQGQSFTLNESVLSLHETDTKVAREILQKIFKDEDEVGNQEDPGRLEKPTLENKALIIYQIISAKERVVRSEFEEICAEYGFFVDAAIDSINEWAFEKVNAPVIEDDTDIIIDREIADELEELGNI